MSALAWIRARAHHRGLHGQAHVNKQRHRSLVLLTFGAVRIAGWTLLFLCVCAGLLHAPGFHWAKVLSVSVPFVVLISIYANWATDLDAATAAFAALVAADAHAVTEDVRREQTVDFEQLERDVVSLAALSPGPDAQALADQICQRLAHGGDAT